MKPYIKISLEIMSFLCTGTVHAAESADSVVYQGQTISGSVNVQYTPKLIMRNIVVTPNGHLVARSCNGIELTESFEVQYGGTLELNCGQLYRLGYTYDSNGNVQSRRKE